VEEVLDGNRIEVEKQESAPMIQQKDSCLAVEGKREAENSDRCAGRGHGNPDAYVNASR
jgi:hypothetical protein